MSSSDLKEEKSNAYINIASAEYEVAVEEAKEEELIETLEYEDPDLLTRMFYAQRYIEQQYEYIKEHGGLFKFFDKWLFNSWKIESLSDNGIEYPKWENNNLSTRTTNWIVCVGLVTSEIMGAYLIPNSFSMLGFVPSNIMLVVFFGLTLLSGGVIWWVFVLLDSPEFSVKTFADIAYIIGGQPFKQLIIFLQLVSTILTCGVIIISAGECVIILRDNRMCWVGLLVLLAGVMMLLSLIKKLSVIGKYCLMVTFINYISLFIQLGYIGHSEPNWANALSVLGIPQGPIETYGITPGMSLMNRVVAIANISYVFAGSIVFPEIISELKRPFEFWKTLISAETIILIVYLIFGNYIYAYQGQFSNSPAVFGVSNINAMKGLSFITFVTSFFQGLVFGHISCKIVYKNYIPMIIKTIRFESKRGLTIWVAIVFLIWIAIFVIGAGVPQVGAVSAFTSSLTVTPLTYIVPYITHLYMLYKIENISNITNFIPFKTKLEKTSLWQFSKSGYKKHWVFSFLYSGICLGAFVLLGMGLWASVEYIKYIFDVTDASSFSCTSPI